MRYLHLGICWNVSQPSKTHLKLKSLEIALPLNIQFLCQLCLNICTEHGSYTAVLYINFHNDSITDTHVLDEQDVARFECHNSFGRILRQPFYLKHLIRHVVAISIRNQLSCRFTGQWKQSRFIGNSIKWQQNSLQWVCVTGFKRCNYFVQPNNFIIDAKLLHVDICLVGSIITHIFCWISTYTPRDTMDVIFFMFYSPSIYVC